LNNQPFHFKKEKKKKKKKERQMPSETQQDKGKCEERKKSMDICEKN
jgi:hypothetical protein